MADYQHYRQELRQEAQTRLRQHGLDRLPANLSEAEDLLEELRIHHIELEIQNEELRRAEQALEQSYQNYYLLYDEAPIAYFVLDANGTILSANQAGAALLGYPPAQMVDTRFERFVAHAERDAFFLHRQQVIDTQQRQQIELSLLAADRSPRYAVVESTLRPPPDGADGQPQLLVAALDRTAQEHLREAYRLLVEHSLQGMAIFQDDRLVFANPALAKITGYSIDELLAMDQAALNQALHAEDREQVWSRMQAQLNGQSVPANQELRFIHRAGQVSWLEFHSVVIEYRGRPAVQTSFLDITARRAAEQALEQSQKFIERVSNAAPLVIYIFDLIENRNVYINEQVTSMLGYTFAEFAEFQDDVLRKLIHPDDQPSVESYLRQLSAGELDKPVYEYEYRMRNAQGEWCWILSRDVVFSRTAKGLPRQILGTMQNIAERKANEAEREQLLAEVSRQREDLRALSARLADLQEKERAAWSRELHDQIGQNLSVLGFNLNYVRGQLSDASARAVDEHLADALQLIEETTDRVRDLLADLRPPMMEQNGLVDSLDWYARQFAKRTGLEIRVEDKTEQHRLMPTAEIALFRIVQETLTNIAKHAQANSVQITLGHRDDNYRLTIADDGRGFQVLPPTGTRSDRLHLGLLTMRERAEAAGGSFQIESEPGRGTTIVVEVPEQ